MHTCIVLWVLSARLITASLHILLQCGVLFVRKTLIGCNLFCILGKFTLIVSLNWFLFCLVYNTSMPLTKNEISRFFYIWFFIKVTLANPQRTNVLCCFCFVRCNSNSLFQCFWLSEGFFQRVISFYPTLTLSNIKYVGQRGVEREL